MFKKLVAIVFIFQLSINSQTKIEWLTSNPGGTTLNCFAVLDDSTFIAAGINSILAKSSDAGKSWIINSSFLNRITEFRKIHFFNKDEGVILGDVKPEEDSKIYYTNDGGLNWIESQFSYNAHISDWIFINEKYGIAIGPYELYKTNDGGKSWNKEMLEIGYKFNSIIKNVDGSLCISCERVISWGNKFTPKNIAGAIIVSNNNGSTWEKLIEFKDKIVLESYFVDSNTGIICCYDGNNIYIYKTIDRGKTYTEKMVKQSERIKDLFFPIKDIGMLMLNRGILFSDNKGETWNIKYTDGSTLNSFYYSGNTIYTIGGSIRFSLDNGYNWENLNMNVENFKGTTEIVSEKILYRFYDSKMWKSTDSGSTWINIATNLDGIVSGSFINSEIGSVIYSNGRIARTEDGGSSWKNYSSSKGMYIQDLVLYDKNIGVVICSLEDTPDTKNGAALYTTDGGKNWAQSILQSPHLTSVDFADKYNWFAVGFGGVILKSTDSGKTWNLNYNLQRSDLFSVSFSTRDIGYAVGSSNTILKTTDCGKNWELVDFKINIGKEVWYYEVKFWGDFGVITASSGFLTTIDGGKNWNYEYIGNSPRAISLYKNQCYLSGEGTTIKFWKNGKFDYGKSRDGGFGEDVDTTNLSSILFLEQNYPNPFNGLTTITFSLPENTIMKLNIYNALGQLVDTPINGYRIKGRYTYNYQPLGLAAGIYFYELVTIKGYKVKKMIYLK